MLHSAIARPPLDIVALFNDDIPAALSLTVDDAPPFDARRLDPPFAPFTGHLADSCQPLTSEERRAAETAQSALVLRCSADLPPAERLPGAVELMRRCCEHGAVAIVLPAAQKMVGRSALAALAPELDGVSGWLKLFLQLYTIHDEQYAWSHTHGMEHLGLPDLECRTTLAEAPMGERLILGCIHQLMQHGGDTLNVGDFVAAEEDHDHLLSRFWVYPPRDVEDHHYGAYGALQLVPDPRPYDPAGNAMDALALLTSIIEARSRAHDLDLRGADLSAAELSSLAAERVDLRTADLRRAKLRAARLVNCRLGAAKLEDTDWSGATLRQCVLDAAHSARACFDNARIEDSSAKGADLSRASLRGARLTETSFARAVLHKAALDGAQGDAVEFRGADLAGATLVGARLDEADFRGADLRDADLTRARFRAADFRGAILDSTRFDEADCAGARFDDGEAPPSGSPSRDAGNADARLDEAAEAAVGDAFAALQGALQADGAVATAELLDRLQQAMAELNAAGDEPPEAWKPWLEPLMKMANGEQPFDLQVVLDALSSLAQAGPKVNEPPPQ
jgi:uncharacterized protein YjbI with pentapeptide repeats